MGCYFTYNYPHVLQNGNIEDYHSRHDDGSSHVEWNKFYCDSRNIYFNVRLVRCEAEADAPPNFVSGEEIELFDFLTSNYDVRKRPGPPQQAEPLEILNSLYVYFIGNFEAQHLEFETHLLFRHKWQVEKTSKQKQNKVFPQ